MPLGPALTGATLTLLLTQAASLIVVVMVARASRLLRPVSDDYCIAGWWGAKGVIGGVTDWWQSWSGDLVTIFISTISTGIPLAVFPMSLASSVPFLAAGTVLSIAVLATVSLALRSSGRSGWWLVLQVPVIILLWWSYLWLPQDPQTGGPSSLALGLTHWQTLNGGYILPTSLLLTLLVLTIWITPRWTRVEKLASFVVGVLFGLGGPVLGLALLLAAAATIVFVVIWKSTLPKRFVRTLILLGTGALVGLAIAMTSPGARIRRDYVNPSTEVSPRRFLEILDFVFPTALAQWGEAYLTWGALLVLLTAGATTWLAVKIGFNWSIPYLIQMVAVSVTFTLILSIANRTTEAFVYDAYWHQSVIRFSAFVSLVLAGVLLGQYLGRKDYRILPPMIVTIITICLIASLGATLAMTTSIYQREEEWKVGPAPIPGVAADIEDQEVWVYGCWLTLNEVRDLPARG